MVDVEVRAATTEDAPAIARVHVRSWQAAYRGLIHDEHLDALDENARADGWRAAIRSGRGRVLVADTRCEVVGFAALMASRDDDAEPECGEVGAIYLVQEVWGRGLGRALMDVSLERLTHDGFTEATLWVLRGNERAIRFYERAGFRPDGTEKTDESRGYPLHELRYRRPLTGP